jgi:nitrogen regulatory protein PII
VRDLVDYSPHVRVEVFCPEDLVYEVRHVIRQAAQNGADNDGQLFVMEGGKAICIQETEAQECAA